MIVVPATAAPAGVVVAVGVLTATLVGVLAFTAAAAAAGGGDSCGGDSCGCDCAGESLAASGGSAGAGDTAAMMSIGFSRSRRIPLSSLCNSEHCLYASNVKL